MEWPFNMYFEICGGGGEGGTGQGGRGGSVRVNHDTDGGGKKAGAAGGMEPADRLCMWSGPARAPCESHFH